MSSFRKIAAALALAAALGPAPARAQFARTAMSAPLPDAQLVDQDGRGFAFGEQRGRVVLIAFVYTSCHHVCPLIVQAVGAVQARVRAEGGSDLRVAFVTVDPEIDSPQVLGAYARRRGADLATSVFLTGSPQALRAVWEGFGVPVRRLGRGLVDHPPATFLVDARGVIRYRYLGTALDVAAVVADVRAAARPGER